MDTKHTPGPWAIDGKARHPVTLIILHAKDTAIQTPVDNLLELRKRLYLTFAYEETLGDVVYKHYDVWGVRSRPVAA